MKFGKPQYDAANKLYKCEVKEGFRCETSVEAGSFTPPLDSFLPAMRESVSQELITLTKGWFSKPLDLKYVRERVSFTFSSFEIPPDFEGTLAWQATSFVISKTSFLFQLELNDIKEAEKVVIDFPEEDSDRRVRHAVPQNRAEHKELVMRERERAARYLFRAERLTQEYCSLYGDDTDWEDESDEDDSEA